MATQFIDAMKKSGVLGNLYTKDDIEEFEIIWGEWTRKQDMLRKAINKGVDYYEGITEGGTSPISTNLSAALNSFAAFNADGDDYDASTAIKSGMSEQRMGQSLGRSVEPSSGLVLIGREHKDWDSIVEWQQSLGNKIIRGDDGRDWAIHVPSVGGGGEYSHDIVTSGVGGDVLIEGEPEEHRYMILKGGQWINDRLLTDREYAFLGQSNKWSWTGGADFMDLNIPNSFKVDSLSIEELANTIKGDSTEVNFSDSTYTLPGDSLINNEKDYFDDATSYINPEMPEELSDWKFVGYSNSLLDRGSPQFENMITGEISTNPLLEEITEITHAGGHASEFTTNRTQYNKYLEGLGDVYENQEQYQEILLALNDIENQKTKLKGNYKGGSSTPYVKERMAKLDAEKTELENSLNLLLQENPTASTKISYYEE